MRLVSLHAVGWLRRGVGSMGIKSLAGPSPLPRSLSVPPGAAVAPGRGPGGGGGGGMRLNQQQQQQREHLDRQQQGPGGGERAGSGGGKRFRGGGLWIAAAAATSVWVRSKGNGAHAEGGGFKEDVVRQYENRVRAYSTPEKIFLYFASVTQDEEKFMTAEDFIQSLMPPSSAPEDEMAARGGKKKGLSKAARRLFQMVDMNGDGLVSFHEYIFVTTIMSIPESRIRVAFDMFDLDGDQELDHEEFSALIEVFKAKSRAGAAARSDVVSTSNAARRNREREAAGSVEYPVLFGKKGNKKLGYDSFLLFLRSLQDDVLRLEFESFSPDRRDTISSRNFAEALISSAYPKEQQRLRKRIMSEEFPDVRIDWREFARFHSALRNLHDVHYALNTFGIEAGKMGGGVERGTLVRAVRAASGMELQKETSDVLFALFADSKSGETLDKEAFLSTLMLRRTRGLAKRREVDPIAFLGCAKSCFSHYVMMHNH